MITIAGPERRLFVRARQRSRTALRAFASPLLPLIEEVGIDRWQLSVTGQWRTTNNVDELTPQQIAELLTIPPIEVDWFRAPERTRYGMKLSSRSKTNSTLGEMVFKVESRGGHNGTLSAWLKNANVTRALSHLLSEHGETSDFLSVIRALEPFDFFSRSSHFISRSFGGGGDNWLPDADLVRRCLGADPFGAFLPVYVDQLHRLVASVLSTPVAGPFVRDGTDVIVEDDEVTSRWQWGDVRVPQIECYFERHHARAIGTVRMAANVALDSLDKVDARRYDPMNSDFVERTGDCFSISTQLNERYRLKIYAKGRSRIRFEVVRVGKGDYGSIHQQDRLLAIMNLERQNLLSQARWSTVGQFFNEQRSPQLNDLARLCSLIADVCVAHRVPIEPILARLLEDGGACSNADGLVPDAILLKLHRIGVVDRQIVRRQDHRLPEKRYTLSSEYRNVMQLIRTALIADR